VGSCLVSCIWVFSSPLFSGIPSGEILNPRNTWEDKDAYDERAAKLASEFSAHFAKTYGNKGIDPAVAAQCPGK